MSNEKTTYPFIKSLKEIIQSYEEFEIKMSPENFQNPQPQVWQRVYLEIASKVMFKTPEDVAHYMTLGLSLMDLKYRFMYTDPVSNSVLVHLMQQLLRTCCHQGEPFSLCDLFQPTYPDKKRLYNMLSCLLNFLRYQEQMCAVYNNGMQQHGMELRLKEELQNKMAAMKTLQDQLTESFKVADEKYQELERQENIAKANLKEVYSDYLADKMILDNLNSQINNLNIQQQKQDERRATIHRKLEETSSKIIHSPHKLQQEVNQLKDTNSKLLAKRNDYVMNLRKTRDEGAQAELMISECSDFLVSIDSTSAINNKDLLKTLSEKDAKNEEKMEELHQKRAVKESKLARLSEVPKEMAKTKARASEEKQEMKKLKAAHKAKIEKNKEKVVQATAECLKMNKMIEQLDEDILRKKQLRVQLTEQPLHILKRLEPRSN